MDWECKDIILYGDDGVAVYSGPRFLRCVYSECGSLMTHGELAKTGKCLCGGRKFRPSLLVKDEEKEKILSREIATLDWEWQLIHGEIPEIQIGDANV